MAKRRYRVGADIGGTFTDVVLLENDETIHTCKVSSTPPDYSLGILAGINELLTRIGGEPADIEEVIHATTVATNAVLEGKGAKTALVTTRGFRDVVEIGRLRIPELYNLNYEKPVPLALRRHRYEVSERLAADGDVLAAVNENEVADIADRIAADGVKAVAVSFLHSYANRAHEDEVGAILEKRLPKDVYISKSVDVLPEIREYERTSTVVVNAYLGPVVKNYLLSLSRRLKEAGIVAPLSVMQSNGGAISAEAATEIPASIIESGPAAGVIAAAGVGKACGYDNIITIDMGGTTAKAAMIEDGEPTRTTEYEVGAGINLSSKLVKGGGHAVKMPFIDVSEIGAGGGSIVRLDDGGLMRVGPDSAGSVPGPVCYDTGGERPTFTDAAVTLGFVNPGFIAGGSVKLKAEKAREALREQIARPAGMELLEAAHGVYSIAAATMMRAVKAVSTYQGRDPRDFSLFAFGGNGPIMAVEIARLLEMKRIVVPPSPGVFSAMGLLFSETRREFLQTVYRRMDALLPAVVAEAFAGLKAKAHDTLLAEGCPEEEIECSLFADIRYAGQAYELTIPLAGEAIDLDVLAKSFHEEHARTYGHASPEDRIELVNIRVTGRRKPSEARAYRPQQLSPRQGATSKRTAYFGPLHGSVEVPVIDRPDLLAGPMKGPLIVEEYDSTSVVQPGWTASLDSYRNIIISQDN
jgi:N-methylhydantoinase A